MTTYYVPARPRDGRTRLQVTLPCGHRRIVTRELGARVYDCTERGCHRHAAVTVTPSALMPDYSVCIEVQPTVLDSPAALTG